MIAVKYKWTAFSIALYPCGVGTSTFCRQLARSRPDSCIYVYCEESGFRHITLERTRATRVTTLYFSQQVDLAI